MDLRLSKKMLVEERIDFEVRITISTKMLPNTPTVKTMLLRAMCILYNDIDLDAFPELC